MKRTDIEIDGGRFPLYSLNTLIIGSGAAGLAAAVELHRQGQNDIAIVTEDWDGGTSANAGSDKQTYYKLSLAPGAADSPLDMARDLTRGGSMHGDIALIEAVYSLPAFYGLVRMGVPFPHDRFGAYVGYKTDHDPRQRATSAGPLTSRFMFDALAGEVKARGIAVMDRTPVVGLLTEKTGRTARTLGAIGLDTRDEARTSPAFILFNAANIILATGGPAGMYRSSVYPERQTGSHGLAFEAGAEGHNLTESQFGIGSVKFRWNLSGSYQQAVPRYFSTSSDGSEEREFLNEFFPDMGHLATAIFLKGYQWPFDPRKIGGCGSSLIDVLVHHETSVLGRRVFIDYTRNPAAGGKLKEFKLSLLSSEARSYLGRCGALLPTPLARLKKMNEPALDLFKRHGIDLSAEPLEIAVGSQHNNGGLKGNIWWETTIQGLFAAGEVMGTHGVYRPGGTALNAGQAGALRAAMFIARRSGGPPPDQTQFLEAAAGQIRSKCEWAEKALLSGRNGSTLREEALDEIRSRMTDCGSIVRSPDRVRAEIPQAWRLYRRLQDGLAAASVAELASAFKCLDLCLTHCLYLEAIGEYLDKGGRSRGSFLVLDPSGRKPCAGLDDAWRFKLARETDFVSRHIQEVRLEARGRVRKSWVEPRPIPRDSGWFETIWNDFRTDRIIRKEDGHDV